MSAATAERVFPIGTRIAYRISDDSAAPGIAYGTVHTITDDGWSQLRIQDQYGNPMHVWVPQRRVMGMAVDTLSPFYRARTSGHLNRTGHLFEAFYLWEDGAEFPIVKATCCSDGVGVTD